MNGAMGMAGQCAVSVRLAGRELVGVDEDETPRVKLDRPPPRGWRYALTRNLDSLARQVAEILYHDAVLLGVGARIHSHRHIDRKWFFTFAHLALLGPNEVITQ